MKLPMVSSRPTRREFAGLLCMGTAAVLGTSRAAAQQPSELILINAKIATLDPTRPEASALAVHRGLISAVGTDREVLAGKSREARVIDLGGRRVIPGLNDSHIHPIRAGRFYNAELRWDGVASLELGLEMIAEQARRTPKGQWVRVIGGWSPYQFAEKRLPTPEELTRASPNRPVFVLFLYSRGFLNKAGVDALKITSSTSSPPGGRYELTPDGGAVLWAEPSSGILNQTMAGLPELTEAQQVNSTRHFYRELNRFGLTSAIDAGGGGHAFPRNYVGSRRLADAGEMPLRLSYFLFPQKPGQELADLRTFSQRYAVNVDRAKRLAQGFVLEGAGEGLTFSAIDFENFSAPRPDITRNPNWREELTAVTRLLLQQRWPLRIHATYGESIRNILDVFEAAHQAEVAEQRPGFRGIRWAIDHAETVRPSELRRIKALGGGIAVQNRMAYAGEFFAERYGREAAAAAPIRDMIEMGIPVGAGTDATRVASYPWVALWWLVTGKTVGGAALQGERHRLSRAEALQLYTVGSAWFSGEEAVKGRLAPGQYADLAVLTDDYFTIQEDRIPALESVLTITGGQIMHGAGEYAPMAPVLPAVEPAWSPVAHYGGWQG